MNYFLHFFLIFQKIFSLLVKGRNFSSKVLYILNFEKFILPLFEYHLFILIASYSYGAKSNHSI